MEIEKAVEAADAIIVCLTKGSITKEGYVQRELRIVLDFADYKPEGTIYILPVRLEECEPPRRLRAWQYADYFEGQRERSLERLLVSLKRRADTLVLKYKVSIHKRNEKPVKKPAIETLNPASIDGVSNPKYKNSKYTKRENEKSEISQNEYINKHHEQQSLPFPIEFRIEMPRDGQIVRNKDCPILASGTYYSKKNFHAWVILDDENGNFYLQYPPIKFFPIQNRWEATNIKPGLGIEHIHFIYVNNQGNSEFHNMVSEESWGGFKELPSNSYIFGTISIRRVKD
jgi:hypothetical protein